MASDQPPRTDSDLAQGAPLAQQLVEGLPVQIWSAAPDGQLDFVTEHTARTFGLSTAQLLIDGWKNVVHPDDLPLAIERWTHALTTGEPYEVEVKLKLADGRYAWHLARANAQRGPDRAIVRWLGTNTNIQRQHDQQDRLTEQNALLGLEADVGAALTRSSTLQVSLVACMDAIVRRIGAAFARIWSVDDQGELLELRASAGIYTHTDGAHSRIRVGEMKIGTIAASRKPHATNSVVGDAHVKDQAWALSERMQAFAGYPLLVGDTVVGVVATFSRQPFSDAVLASLESIAHPLALAIERGRSEKERARLLQQEQEARQTAEHATRSMDAFLANVSHELRTPLNVMLGWTRLLLAGHVPEDGRQKALATVERNATMQARLIEDLLDVSRIIAGNMKIEIAPLDLVQVIELALDVVRPAAEAKGVELRTQFAAARLPYMGDAGRLQQVVWNLLANAVKFTGGHGAVTVALTRVDAVVKLVVSDSGQGIEPELLGHIFERFRQANTESRRTHGGLGLGLAIVKHLVELHGGHVRAESLGLGHGATFVVDLPSTALVLPSDVDLTELASDPPRSAPPVAEIAGVRILIVEDEPDGRELLMELLERAGGTVRPVASADEAIKALDEANFDIVVSDIGMAGRDGYALAREVRERSPAHGGDVRMIALTAYARPEERVRTLRAGFDMHVPKPVDGGELIAAIVALVRRAPGRVSTDDLGGGDDPR